MDSLPWRLSGLGSLAETGVQRGQVLEPAGLAVDVFGRTYVTDAALHRLQWFDRNGRLLGETGSLGSDRGQMRRPGSVTPLGAARVAVLDRENRRVLTYDLFGRPLDAIDLTADRFVSGTGAIDPIALASDRGGALYIVDAARERILALDFSGNLQRTIDRGAAGSQFRGLRGLAVAPRGDLITAEVVGARSPGVKRSGALAVAVDDTGRVAVADEAAGTVWVYDANGVPLARLAGLSAPRAVAFAPGGVVLVAETAPGRVRRFQLAPAPPGAAGSPR